jgi:hypothetical protein
MRGKSTRDGLCNLLRHDKPEFTIGSLVSPLNYPLEPSVVPYMLCPMFALHLELFLSRQGTSPPLPPNFYPFSKPNINLSTLY